MKILTVLLGVVLVLSIPYSSTQVRASEEEKMIYDFSVKSIDGKEVQLKDYKGKVLLIVNTASKCGFTPQYKDLQEIYQKYKEKGLLILGFPANDFGQQEPGNNPEIKEFCSLNYQVDFPLFEKISVKGESQHPLFKFLTEQKNPDFTGEIKWNFEKILIGRDGQLLRRFRSKVKPSDSEMVEAIETALKSH
jgi:glutathione peroxidase